MRRMTAVALGALAGVTLLASPQASASSRSLPQEARVSAQREVTVPCAVFREAAALEDQQRHDEATQVISDWMDKNVGEGDVAVTPSNCSAVDTFRQ
jgi:hypothetical protein